MTATEPGDYSPEGLVMPFVVCASQGGPFDDDAFVAGWRCGVADAMLAGGGMMHSVEARERELPQLDLIAMRRGYKVLRVDRSSVDDEWFLVTFRKVPR